MSAKYVILLGPPGAGKGTQAATAAEATGLLHLATGDMFRENVREGTELGVLAKGYMDRGELVPDEVTIGMLLERIGRDDASKGCLLDGFPRTVEQAEALDAALADRGDRIAAVLLIDVGDDEVLRRLGGRWSCADCGAVFHEVFNPPKVERACDRCSAALMQRGDDQPEAIGRRLLVYSEQTAPLIAFYDGSGRLSRVNGEQAPGAVGAELLAALERSGASA